MLPEQIGEQISVIHDKLEHGEKRMNTFETLIEENRVAHKANADALAENTELTKEIKDILELGKTFFKILGFVAVVAKWITAIGAAVALIWAATHGNTPGK
jgi:ABC-type branched-subunit amino acid transport system substrate-binding protein